MAGKGGEHPNRPWSGGQSATAGWLVLGLLAGLGACTPFNPDHLRLTPQTLEKRQMQTRTFDTGDEDRITAACAAVLQDLGFLIDESEKPLGLIIGSKERSAIQPLQVTAAVILLILTQDSRALVFEDRQIMRICLVAAPARSAGGGTSVRVTFQRIVYLNNGSVSRSEALGTPEIYQEFFSRLSKSLFLEAREL